MVGKKHAVEVVVLVANGLSEQILAIKRANLAVAILILYPNLFRTYGNAPFSRAGQTPFGLFLPAGGL